MGSQVQEELTVLVTGFQVCLVPPHLSINALRKIY